MTADTRPRILDAAEAAFAENGFAATSLREVTTAAGVNLAAVNYHFGSKEALLEAVIERRLNPINCERLALLEELEAEADGRPVPVDRLVHALLAPAFHQHVSSGPQAQFLQLMGRLHAVPHEQVRAIIRGQFDEVNRRFVPAFKRALPHLDEGEIAWRLFFAMGAMINTMMWSGLADVFGGRQPREANSLFHALVDFAVAGMTAPRMETGGGREGVSGLELAEVRDALGKPV